ncbi:hypothetical protein FIC94_06665 [Ochrobactrum teleogrylli]|uniref:Uncharacterized protein n=1 Tax=Ochrobactrum teleogrylli TaxID=2479765 RepID=A0ABY2Y5Q9_9HYPH|nr:hypothetical protein FIC94_06665 [[Ochrobactrum] teleogrylli]
MVIEFTPPPRTRYRNTALLLPAVFEDQAAHPPPARPFSFCEPPQNLHKPNAPSVDNPSP